MIKAVIFDFDGLILDTETHEFVSYQELFQEHGVELSLDVWGKGIGTISDFDPYAHLDECVGQTLNRANLKKLREENFDLRLAAETLRPGVEEYIKAAKSAGLRVGLASSSPAAWVLGHLRHYGILDLFECIRSSDDVTNVKPDPELYLQVLDEFGITPDEALVFEDSPNGALAAERAGIRCVVVPNMVTNNLTFGQVTHRIDSMADIPLADLIVLVG
ncbi:MAG: HAD family hydrolase [Gorillibacterium sp.]|nr:HAD family hydrolase [Gorillibacterium sp.]